MQVPAGERSSLVTKFKCDLNIRQLPNIRTSIHSSLDKETRLLYGFTYLDQLSPEGCT